jgi:GT2 family glycosyltransferase
VSSQQAASFAPVALFVYNRPWHVKRTVEALKDNELASKSDLFIFSDAAKNPDAAASVLKTRAFIKTIRGFKSVNIVEREENIGLAASIIGGVTQLCDQFGSVIVMEDDLITSRHFLRFMNDSLDLYRDDDRVMHISGSTYPVRDCCRDSSYFLRLPLCWGWGTWTRAWKHFEKKISVMDRFDRDMIAIFNFDGTYDYWSQLEMNRSGRMSTWFIFWYATVFLRNGLVLFPKRSLVKNIGMDGTGVHCGATTDFDVEVSQEPIQLTRIPLELSESAYRYHKKYFKSLLPSLGARGVRKAKNIIKRVWMRGRGVAQEKRIAAGEVASVDRGQVR